MSVVATVAALCSSQWFMQDPSGKAEAGVMAEY
jgi:hypothetical protein